MNPEKQQEEIKEALDIFMKLPQAEHITEAQVNEFIQAVLDINESPAWHMKRLGYIGPSEAGFLAATYMNANRGIDEPFISTMKDARDVVLQKLMRVMPEEIPATKRGKRTEEYTRKFFVEDLREQGFVVERATKELEVLNAARTCGAQIDPNYPWLPVPSIDDLLYVTNPETNETKLVLPDYKDPSVDMFKVLVNDVGVPYAVQLHLYKYGLGKLGINVDQMCLAPFNREDASVPMIPVEYDKKLEQIALKACNLYYQNAILTGNAPPRVSTALEAYDPADVPESAYENAALYAAAAAIEDEAANIKRSAQLALRETFKDVRTATQTSVSLGPTNVSLRPIYEYDVDELYRVAKELSVEILSKDTDAQILKKVDKQAQANGISLNIDNLRAVQHLVTVRTATGNKAGAHLMKGVKQDSAPLTGEAIERLYEEITSVTDAIKDNAQTEKDRIDYVAKRNEAILSAGYSNSHLVSSPEAAPPHKPRKMDTITLLEQGMESPQTKEDMVVEELNSGLGQGPRNGNETPDSFIASMGGVRM